MATQRTDALTLWYDKPAAKWTEALPLGNGRLGATLFGGVTNERVALNELTLWAGGPHDYGSPDALAALPEIRRLVFAGEWAAAQALCEDKFMGRPIKQMPYRTMGDLRLSFPQPGAVTGYRRELDLGTAVARVTYSAGGVTCTREAFASVPDQVLVLRLSADKPGSIGFMAVFDGPPGAETATHGSEITVSGTAGAADGVSGVTRWRGMARLLAEGGTVQAADGQVTVSGADAVTVIVSLATSYKNYADTSGDPDALAAGCLETTAQKSYADLKAAHIADYQRLFSRVTLDLGASKLMAPTDVRLRAFQDDPDPALAALHFQYGRYLLISSSQPGGQPANLQGLWNENLDPAWGSKYTININTEMNYWPAETCGLSECAEPLFQMLAELAESGRHTAKTHYGARGWVAHHNTDAWRGTAPVDGALWGMWMTGGAWLCTHLWEHYLFTQDKSALARYYPVLRSAAEFFLDTLVEEPAHGWLVTCPSVSPENSHHPNANLCAGPTMDNQILRDLFGAVTEAAVILGIDPEFQAAAADARVRLAPMQIGSGGRLQEWLEDWDDGVPEPHHRHVSHLYGLHPSSQITKRGTPELFRAARASLEGRGDAGTGWSLAWKINLWARLEDGDRAEALVRQALAFVDTDNTNY